MMILLSCVMFFSRSCDITCGFLQSITSYSFLMCVVFLCADMNQTFQIFFFLYYVFFSKMFPHTCMCSITIWLDSKPFTHTRTSETEDKKPFILFKTNNLVVKWWCMFYRGKRDPRSSDFYAVLDVIFFLCAEATCGSLMGLCVVADCFCCGFTLCRWRRHRWTLLWPALTRPGKTRTLIGRYVSHTLSS